MDDRAIGSPNDIGDNSIFGTSYIPQSLLLEPWWSVDQPVPLGSSEDRSNTANGSYTQTGPLLNGFVYRYDTGSIDHWTDTSPMTDYIDPWYGLGHITEYTPLSSGSEHMAPKESPSVQVYCHPASTSKKANRKRNRDSGDLPPRKSARRGLLGDEDINQQTEKKVKHSTVRRKRNGSSNGAHSAQQGNGHIRMIQKRNPIASNKFRVMKREDLLRLESSEQGLERIHRDLSTCVADLTLEVYELKMQLLQHSGCNCAFIQSYLVHESQRYVQKLEKSQREASNRQP